MYQKPYERSLLSTTLSSFFLVLGIYGMYYFIKHTRKPLAKLTEIPQLVVGTSADFPPFSSIENNEIVGFDIDIAKEALKRISKNYELKDMPFSILVPQLQLGKIHIIAAGMTPTEERAKRVHFSTPYFEGDPFVVITPSNKPTISSLDDLQGKTVIVNQGYTAESYMEGIKGPILHRLKSPAEAFLALQSGCADAYVTAQSTVKPYFDTHDKSAFNLFVIPDTSESTALIISQHYPELVIKINEALESMKHDGTIELIKKKWNLI